MIEFIIIMAGVPGLFGKNHVYKYGRENMAVNFGAWDEETGGCFVSESSGQEGIMADFTDISLPRGVYSIKLQYETDTFMKNRVEVSGGTAGYKSLLTNGEHCYPAYFF